jgi:hypothetical protein
MVDRPSAGVLTALNHVERHLPDAIELSVLEAPTPILSGAGGEQWMSNLQVQHAHLLAQFDAQAILVLDDDQLFTVEGLKELKGHLGELKYDRYSFLSLFMWDDPGCYNASMTTHWSDILYRVYPGDTYSTKFVNHSTEACARSKQTTKMVWPLRNFGYLTADDRREAWDRSREAGRVDAFTLNFNKKNAKTIEWNPETWIQQRSGTSGASSTARGASPQSGPVPSPSPGPPVALS